jgi:hypothetical protein
MFVFQITDKSVAFSKDAYSALCCLHFISKMYDIKTKWCFFYPYIENTEFSFVKKNTKSICSNCYLPSETKFKVCSGCKSQKVFYCSVDCQNQHWSEHKKHCEKIETQNTQNTKKPKTYLCTCCYFLSTTKFKICGGCKPNKVRYCSKECQKLHWPRHKQYCNIHSIQ